jgi:hypothetical protein
MINIFAVVLYIVGAICIIGGVVAGLAALSQNGAQTIGMMVGGLVIGIIYIIIGKVTKEAAFMLADVADCLTDQNSRNERKS